MMTKRSKQKFYSVALCVVLGILLLPLLFLAGCSKNPPPDLIRVVSIETADTKIHRQIRIDEMWAEAKESLLRSESRVAEEPSNARAMSLGAGALYRMHLVQAIEGDQSH